jgi:hypothetical protein
VTDDRNVLFGLGLESGVHQVGDMLTHACGADDAGLDVFSIGDHPYFAERLDAYAALGYVLGATRAITGAVIMTNRSARRRWRRPAGTRTDGSPDTSPTGAANKSPERGRSSTKPPPRPAGTPPTSTRSTKCPEASPATRSPGPATRTDAGPAAV